MNIGEKSKDELIAELESVHQKMHEMEAQVMDHRTRKRE